MAMAILYAQLGGFRGRRMAVEGRNNSIVGGFISKYFGPPDGITRLFPYLKDYFKWKDKEEIPVDVRVVLKNNVEYRRIERHARQYHMAGMYQEAYEFWLIAASWRERNMRSNGFSDQKHLNAIAFTIQNLFLIATSLLGRGERVQW